MIFLSQLMWIITSLLNDLCHLNLIYALISSTQNNSEPSNACILTIVPKSFSHEGFLREKTKIVFIGNFKKSNQGKCVYTDTEECPPNIFDLTKTTCGMRI